MENNSFLYRKNLVLGIIKKQAIRNAAFSFTGAFFGAGSRMSMPLFLSEAQIGLLSLLDAISGMFAIIFCLGFEQVLIRVFPKFRNDESGHNGFLAFGLYLSFIGVLFGLIVFYFGEHLFLGDNSETNKWFLSFSFLVFPLILFRILFKNLDGYARMLFNSVIGVFLESLLTKVVLLLSLVALAVGLIDFRYLVYIQTINLCLPGLIIFIYSIVKTEKITKPSPKLLSKNELRGIFGLVIIGVLTGTSGSLVLYVDSLMVNKLLSLEALGIYATLFFAARLLIIPSTGIARISTTILAEAWTNKDMKKVQEIYEKSALNQLIIGAYLFGIGWLCIRSVLSLTPKFEPYLNHAWVFFFLGLGLLIEMSAGVNTSIIKASEKYKYNMYFAIVLAVCVVILNYIFIQKWNIEGAAIASMFAMIIVNFLRWFMLRKYYGLQPFNKNFLKGLILASVFIIAASLIKFDLPVVTRLIVYSTGFTLIFWVTVVGLKISPDINEWLRKMKNTYLTKK